MQKQTRKREQEVDVHFRIHTQNKNTQLHTIQRSIDNTSIIRNLCMIDYTIRKEIEPCVECIIAQEFSLHI